MGERPAIRAYGEALLIMIVASVAIRLWPFKRVALWATQTAPIQGTSPLGIADIVRVTEAWSRRLPWRTLCLEQGITAARLLSRHGSHATLFYGAAMIDGELKAHVWVRSGDRDVIGCETAGNFALLSQFSNDPS